MRPTGAGAPPRKRGELPSNYRATERPVDETHVRFCWKAAKDNSERATARKFFCSVLPHQLITGCRYARQSGARPSGAQGKNSKGVLNFSLAAYRLPVMRRSRRDEERPLDFDGLRRVEQGTWAKSRRL
jgi:hypothetical protein